MPMDNKLIHKYRYQDRRMSIKQIYKMILTTLLILIFSGCTNSKINFSKNVFLKYYYAPAGECTSYEFYHRNIEVSSDGTVKIYCDEFEETHTNKYPTKEIQLSEEDITALKDAIMKNHIISLPKDISEDSCDGGYSYLTIYTVDGIHETGGLNVSNKKFEAVEDLLYGMVEEDAEELFYEIDSIQEQGNQININ